MEIFSSELASLAFEIYRPATEHQENEYPLKPLFYIVKLGYAGVYLFFLFLLQNIDCGYSLEPPQRVPTIYVLSKNKKNIYKKKFY